jgi:hypothetical protein
MTPSANLSAKRARHRTVLSFWICRLFCRQFHQWIGRVTIRDWRFESLGESVGISIGESVTSPYGADVLNPSVKNTPNNLHVSEPLFFKKILNIPSVISSVYTDGWWPSVVTDEITDGVKSVGNGDPKLPTELFHR